MIYKNHWVSVIFCRSLTTKIKNLDVMWCVTDVLEQSAKHIAKHAQVAFGTLWLQLMYMF